MASEKKLRDNIKRGKGNSPLGTALFVGLRALDPFLQYAILGGGLGASIVGRLGLRAVPQGVPAQTGTIIDNLGLSPYRLILLAMAVGSSVKQIYWKLAIANEEMEPASAVIISLFNTVCNSLNTLLFTCAFTSAVSGTRFSPSAPEGPTSYTALPPSPILIGGVLYVVGLLTEAISEIQRKNFKGKPENKGKNYGSGLFSLARHINYGGYTLWRTGFALAASGYTWAALVFAHFFYDFSSRGIPVLDKYCQDRYGQQWEDFKKRVPYKMIPFLY